MIELVDGRLRLICDNPEHRRGWLYPPAASRTVVREFARSHGWSVYRDMDLCPQCTRLLP